MFVVDDVKVSSADYKVCEWNGVGYVIAFVPGNNWICTKEPVDEAGNDTDGILITETPEFITMSTEEEFKNDHVIYGLVGAL